jgi:hypothetical protein
VSGRVLEVAAQGSRMLARLRRFCTSRARRVLRDTAAILRKALKTNLVTDKNEVEEKS